MIIETDFDLYDIVYVIEEGKIKKTKIICVTMEWFDNVKHIKYVIKNGKSYYPGFLRRTEEELYEKL